MSEVLNVTLNGGLTISTNQMSDIDTSRYVYTGRDGKTIATFEVFERGGERFIKFPRRMDKFVNASTFRANRENIKVFDERVESSLGGFNISDNFNLRDYQKGPVTKVLNTLTTTMTNSCLLQAEPGFGKSYILPKIVKELGQKTLILVDRNLLRDQMYDEFTTNGTGSVQILTKDTEEIADVNVTTFQMLMKNPRLVSLLREKVGFVIVDECHVAPAKEFASIILSLPAKYRLGLSATPSRSDGLTEVIIDTFGLNIVQGDNPNSLKVFNVVVNTAIPIHFTDKSDYAKSFIKAMFSPLPDNKQMSPMDLAVETAKALYKKGRKVLVYTTYGELQDWLKVSLESEGFTVGVISGKVATKKRDKIIQDFQDGKIDFLVSGVILQKGVSIHKLDTIVNLTPQNKEGMEQTVGRLRREHEAKREPMFIYFTFAGKMIMTNEDRVEVLKSLSKKGDKFSRMGVNKFRGAIR